jgi:hypothetical protein
MVATAAGARRRTGSGAAPAGLGALGTVSVVRTARGAWGGLTGWP